MNESLVGLYISEEVEFKKIQESLLQLKASMVRLGVDINSLFLHISYEDYEYFKRLIESNPNWSANKYCKIVKDGVLSINGIKLGVLK